MSSVYAESRPLHKRPKKLYPPPSPSEMAFFSATATQYLKLPTIASRKRSGYFTPSVPKQDDLDDLVASDLELSFASMVSVHSPHDSALTANESSFAGVPMDISPAPAQKPATTANPFDSKRMPNRPRATTSAARLFGNDLSNGFPPSPLDQVSISNKQGSIQSGSKRTQRAALPTEWLSVPHANESLPTSDDAMDVDTSFAAEAAVAAALVSFSPAPQSAAPTVTSFNALFYDTVSPRRSFESPNGVQPKKRRSLSPEAARIMSMDNSSSPIIPSPSQAKADRLAGAFRLAKPTLQGLGAPASNFLKRPRRPALSAMVQPSAVSEIQSAYPVLTADEKEHSKTTTNKIPVRRAFSALIPSGTVDLPSDESSFDGPDMSSPAQAYAKRQQVRTIRRCDGTDDFRPLTGASSIKITPSKFASGMPGFGDNEAHGKVLPCHRVSEDGLMRIKPQTLDQLLDGAFNNQIADFHVIDCRFDYEYNGGHIPGAINVNTTAGVEELLLGNGLKPRPSTSGDTTRKTILIFHCEFSAKRAPTFAKHLRAKDRAMNNHVYPKIHYPEVYILEGGYCQYFKSSGSRCQPPAYVTMDDPTHASSRREDLDQFRKAKFGRHKSYAYGDALSKASMLSQPQPKRNTAPSGGPNPLFAAATAARTRRGGTAGVLMTLAEDCNTTADADDTDTDVGDSPCPPPTKAGPLKNKKLGRGSMVRAETYGPNRMPY